MNKKRLDCRSSQALWTHLKTTGGHTTNYKDKQDLATCQGFCLSQACMLYDASSKSEKKGEDTCLLTLQAILLMVPTVRQTT